MECQNPVDDEILNYSNERTIKILVTFVGAQEVRLDRPNQQANIYFFVERVTRIVNWVQDLVVHTKIILAVKG
jgi:hypothetical protein